jgi:cytochrome c oxidase subunit 1
MIMRFQLAYPGHPIPLIGSWFGPDKAPGGIMLPEFYNQLGAMHGTIMVFLGVVPLAVGGFGNFVMPLQIGAPDMAFPRINMASYWVYFLGGVVMLSSFFVPNGAAQSGWTSYPPLSDIATTGQTMWLIGMVFLITSSLLGSVNFIVTIVQLRAKGLSFMRMPFFVWAQFVTAFLLLLAFPPLEAAGVLQLMDRLAGTSFFLPSGLYTGGKVLQVAGGGNPLLWQHLFWFLAHPEVYVLILPGMGIVSEVIANNTRKPLWGYRAMVYSIIFLGFMSFIVWAHHMFMTGMGTAMSAFFQTTTMIISIPSVVILTALLLSLWGASLRFTTPMLFALAFLPMFGIGGLTGLPLGLAPADIPLHDTYYVIGHFHYVVAPGTIFALFAGIYYWFPKATGRNMNDLLGKIHFWGSFICINTVFMPMFIQGLGGMNRRLYDGGMLYLHNANLLKWNVVIGFAAWGLGLFQIPFIFNFFHSIWWGKVVDRNPWEATTLEWSAPSPPGHGNFLTEPIVYRGPYEYSVPGAPRDFTPQFEPERA